MLAAFDVGVGFVFEFAVGVVVIRVAGLQLLYNVASYNVSASTSSASTSSPSIPSLRGCCC